MVVYREKPAVIINGGDKIDIIVDGGINKKVRPKDITFLHPGPLNSISGFRTTPGNIDDTLEMLNGETVSFAEFAELLFDEFTPQSAWNAYRLLSEGKYFAGDLKNGITARPPAEIEAAESAAAAKAETAEQREKFIARVRAGKMLPEDAKLMNEVEQLAYGINSSSSIMRELKIEATPQKAHGLLLKTGIWTDKNDPWPLRSGANMTLPELSVPDLPDETRCDLTALAAFAIDDPENRDPDDAISYDFVTDTLWVHVADVAALVPPDSELDLEARERGVNLYFPEQVTPIFPEAITAKLGLGLQEISPALSFALRLAEDGTPGLVEATPSWVKVERITYADATARINEKVFAAMQALTGCFQRRRYAAGAVIIDMPEVKIKLAEDGSIHFMPIASTPGRELVTNAMLMCGEAVGRFAQEKDIPLPYTVQELPDGEISGGDSLAGMFERRKQMQPSLQSLMPGKHSGLGMENYCRVTSPLRRYSDLLVHQQVRAFVTGGTPMDADTLDKHLATSERPARQARSTERTVNEFWTLVYLFRHPGWEGSAVVIDKTGYKATIIIPELAYIIKMRLHDGIELNAEINLKLVHVDLPELSAAFKLK